MIRRLIPLAVAIVLVIGCKKKTEEGGGGGDGTTDGDPNATYELKYRGPQQGDKVEVTVAETMSLELTFEGKSEKETQQKRYEYTEQIVELPKDAKQPTKLTRTYKVAQRSGFAKKQLKAYSFEGKTVNIEKKNKGGYEFTVDGKKLGFPDSVDLESEFRNQNKQGIEALLPKKAVKVGESWTVDPESVKSFLGEVAGGPVPAKSKLECKLTRAYKKDGKQWGVIAFDFDIASDPKAAGKGREGGSESAKADGTLDAVLDGSAPDATLKGNLKGSFSGPGIGGKGEGKGSFDGTVEKSIKGVK